MELFPKFLIDFFGGWLLTLFYLIVNLGLPLSKKRSLKRLLTPAKIHKTFNEKILYIVAQSSWFGTIFLPIIYSIKMNSDIFTYGIIIFIIGTIFTVISLHNFITTPLNEQIKKGLYRYSRNPIYASYNIFGFSMALLTGSWIIFILHIIEIITCHLMVLDEEKYCITKFGDEYKSYMEKVPRYYFGKI